MKTKALLNLRPNITSLIIDNDEIVIYESSDDLPQPTSDELAAEISRLEALSDSTKYQRDRKDEYPSLQDQLDMLYWDMTNGTTNWQEAIAAVKERYPKPE